MDRDPQLLLHLCSVAQWQVARTVGRLEPESLRSAGFVHLSGRKQVHLPATRLFPGRTDLLLLFVDRQRITAPLRWEPGVPGDPEGMRFPHLYGPLPVEAVVRVARYLPSPDGRYPPLAAADESSETGPSSTAGVLSTGGLTEYREA